MNEKIIYNYLKNNFDILINKENLEFLLKDSKFSNISKIKTTPFKKNNKPTTELKNILKKIKSNNIDLLNNMSIKILSDMNKLEKDDSLIFNKIVFNLYDKNEEKIDSWKDYIPKYSLIIKDSELSKNEIENYKLILNLVENNLLLKKENIQLSNEINKINDDSIFSKIEKLENIDLIEFIKSNKIKVKPIFFKYLKEIEEFKSMISFLNNNNKNIEEIKNKILIIEKNLKTNLYLIKEILKIIILNNLKKEIFIKMISNNFKLLDNSNKFLAKIIRVEGYSDLNILFEENEFQYFNDLQEKLKIEKNNISNQKYLFEFIINNDSISEFIFVKNYEINNYKKLKKENKEMYFNFFNKMLSLYNSQINNVFSSLLNYEDNKKIIKINDSFLIKLDQDNEILFEEIEKIELKINKIKFGEIADILFNNNNLIKSLNKIENKTKENYGEELLGQIYYILKEINKTFNLFDIKKDLRFEYLRYFKSALKKHLKESSSLNYGDELFLMLNNYSSGNNLKIKKIIKFIIFDFKQLYIKLQSDKDNIELKKSLNILYNLLKKIVDDYQKILENLKNRNENVLEEIYNILGKKNINNVKKKNEEVKYDKDEDLFDF